jgi:hypothetical protein
MKEVRVGGYTREVQAVIGAHRRISTRSYIDREKKPIRLVDSRNNFFFFKNFLEFYF